MPAWLTVYARESAAKVTPAVLLAELRRADLDTLAEAHDIAPALVRDAAKQLRVDGDSLDGAEIRYRAPDLRPIQVHRWATPERVAEELEEVRASDEPIPARVRPLLDAVVEVVAFELGFGMYEDMGIVLAWEAARIVAHATRGFVKDEDGQWSLVGARGGYEHLG